MRIGFNHFMTDPNDARWGLLTQIGCKLYRVEVPTAAFLDKAASLGIQIFPVLHNTSSTGIRDWLNQTNGSGVKNGNNPGFAGFVTLGNEDYFRVSAGTYIGSWAAGMLNCKSTWPGVKIAAQTIFHNNQNWTHDVFSALGGAAGVRVHFDWWDIHPYSTTTGGAIDPTQNVFGATFWELNNLVNSTVSGKEGLAHFGCQDMPFAATEWGFRSTGAGGQYGTTGQAQQADWYQKQLNVFAQFNVAVATPYTLEDNPGETGIERDLGVITATSANYGFGSATADRLKSSYAVMRNAIAASQQPSNPAKPTVTTTAPQGVTVTGATLTAQVNPNQLSTVVVIDEGPTTAYVNHLTATPNPVPAGTSSVNVTAALTATLTAGQTRHVRASATNSQGTTVGNDLTYTVPTGAQPLQVKVVLNPGDHSQVLIQNVDPSATLVTVAWTPANDANNVTSQNYSAPFPSAVTAPAGSPWGNVAQFNNGTIIGTYWDQAPGGGRVQTTPASGVAPTVATAAASQITVTGALLAGSLNSNNQGAGTGKFNYGTTTGYGSVSSSVPVSGSAETVGTVTFGAVNPGSTASGTSITIPATGANGTFQLGIIGAKGTGAVHSGVFPPTVSPAWGNIGTGPFANAGGGVHKLWLFSKIAASEASGVWNFDQMQPQAGIILALSGVAATSSVRSIQVLVNASSNTCTTPSVAAVTGDWLVYGGFFTNGDTVTFPSGTARQTVTTITSATGTTLFVATEPIVADGQTGVRQITMNNTYGNGADTSCGFAVAVIPAATAAGTSFTVPVSGLTAGTLYHCQAVGTTPGGTAMGTDVTFTTAASGTHAPGVTWLTPTCISAKGVTFAGQIDPGGASTSWKFQYRLKGDTNWTDAVGSPAVTVTGSVSKTVSPGLAFSTLYEAQLSATNSAATTVSPINTFVTKDSGHHKFNQGDTVLVLDVSTPGAPDYLLGTTGLVDIATTTLITASFPTGDVVAFAPWALRVP